MRHKKNADKKVAIIYYKGHGKNALTAGGIEVGDSLLNLLRHLQKAGFNTGNLPESTEELLRQIQDNGIRHGYSNSRTCEIGLNTNSGIPYQSLVYLVDRCTRPKKG